MKISRAILILLAVASSAALAQPEDDESQEDVGFDVQLDASLSAEGEDSSSPLLAAWLAYGLSRGEAYVERQRDGTANQSGDDFFIEHSARSALATVWRELGAAGDTGADEYLDSLGRIADAGFMDEYVIFIFGKPGWTVPADALQGLDPSGFAQFWNAGLTQLDNPTLAMAVPRTHPVFPEEPGGALPDPASLTPTELSCDRSIDTLKAAMADWAEQGSRLDGVPISAATSPEFLFHVTGVRADEPVRSRGATWVSPRVADLAFLSGFCAVELADFELAEEALITAAALQPMNARIKSELAHVYVASGDLDRADAIVESMIEMTDDRCDLGYAWRRRGYIRFEQGRLDEAREAYLKSLDYDPLSELARSELALLDQEIVDQGGVAPEYVPPETVSETTRCGN